MRTTAHDPRAGRHADLGSGPGSLPWRRLRPSPVCREPMVGDGRRLAEPGFQHKPSRDQRIQRIKSVLAERPAVETLGQRWDRQHRALRSLAPHRASSIWRPGWQGSDWSIAARQRQRAMSRSHPNHAHPNAQFGRVRPLTHPDRARMLVGVCQFRQQSRQRLRHTKHGELGSAEQALRGDRVHRSLPPAPKLSGIAAAERLGNEARAAPTAEPWTLTFARSVRARR